MNDFERQQLQRQMKLDAIVAALPEKKVKLKWGKMGKPKLEFANRHHLFKRQPLKLTRHQLIRRLVDSVENGTS